MVDFHDLAPAARTVPDFDTCRGKLEPSAQEIDQGGVGLVIDGRRRDPDLERIAMRPGHCSNTRVGLDVQDEGEPVLRRIEAVPAHGEAAVYSMRRISASSHVSGTVSSSWQMISTHSGERSTLAIAGTNFWNGRRNGRVTLASSGASEL